MEKVDTTWRIFGMYMLVILFMLLGSAASGQIKITQFNAEWNKGNEVNWIDSLSDCQTLAYVDISTQKESQKKHNLSFKMVATRREVQEEIDNQLMSDF